MIIIQYSYWFLVCLLILFPYCLTYGLHHLLTNWFLLSNCFNNHICIYCLHIIIFKFDYIYSLCILSTLSYILMFLYWLNHGLFRLLAYFYQLIVGHIKVWTTIIHLNHICMYGVHFIFNFSLYEVQFIQFLLFIPFIQCSLW